MVFHELINPYKIITWIFTIKNQVINLNIEQIKSFNLLNHTYKNHSCGFTYRQDQREFLVYLTQTQNESQKVFRINICELLQEDVFSYEIYYERLRKFGKIRHLEC